MSCMREELLHQPDAKVRVIFLSANISNIFFHIIFATTSYNIVYQPIKPLINPNFVPIFVRKRFVKRFVTIPFF